MNNQTFQHDTYLSPFTWRYGSQAMQEVWSEQHKRRLWRQVWLALAEAQEALGLVTAEQLGNLRDHVADVDIDRAHQIEAEIKHDLMAELKTYAAQCQTGGAVLHLGATSMDIEDNAEVLRIRDGLDLVLDGLSNLIRVMVDQIEHWASTPCMAFTHLQPAEPTTVGYRLAQYGQDFALDYAELGRIRSQLRGKGLRGAVGTSASYVQLLGNTTAAREMEGLVMNSLGLSPFTVTTQTYPRKQDWFVLNGLAGLAGSLYKFSFDLRLLQSPPLGEWAEPFGKHQVGSSAMPFKRNPINAENIDSLGRLVAAMPRVAWDNAAHSLLERTLDDSANRRVVLPEAFLAIDEMVNRTIRVMKDLVIDEEAIARTLDKYGTFAASERLLMELVKSGADRQEMHELIRSHSMKAWEEVSAGKPNPLSDYLSGDAGLITYLPADQVRSMLNVADYVGDAPNRAQELANELRHLLADS